MYYGPDLPETTIIYTDYDYYTVLYSCNDARGFGATLYFLVRDNTVEHDLTKLGTKLFKKYFKEFSPYWLASSIISEADGCTYE